MEPFEQRFDAIDQRFDGVDQRFDGVDQRLDGIDRRLDGVVERLDGMDHRNAEEHAQTRSDFAEEHARTRRDFADEHAQMRRDSAEEHAQTRRHFDVVAERLRDEIRLLAEGVQGMTPRSEFESFRTEVRDDLAEVRTRLTRLERKRTR